MRMLDYRLSALQAAAMASFIMFVVAMVGLYHHQTEDYAIPFLQYLGSVRIAVPPVIALFGSYVLMFVAGAKLAEAPRLTVSYLRNDFFQSRRKMFAATALFLAASGLVLWYTAASPPPAYARFVTVLLGGEQDRHTIVKNELARLKEKNPEMAKRFGLVADVFEERSRRNFTHASHNTTTPRILVRALEAVDRDSEWDRHPLRKLALAEAYSLWTEASLKSPLRRASDQHWKEWHAITIALNDEVAHSTARLAIPLLRFSAMHNSGNAMLYIGNFKEARRIYEQALRDHMNVSSAGNLIATYVLLGELDEALSFGMKARDWALATGRARTEASSYSSILTNTAFAHLIRDRFADASALLLEAYDLEPDNLNALNLAVSLGLEGDAAGASFVLSQFKYPPLDPAHQARRVSESYDACYYLVQGLLTPSSDLPAVAAHLHTYLGQARTLAQLKAENASTASRLRAKVSQALAADRTPCRHLLMIPGIKRKLAPGPGTGASRVTAASPMKRKP